MQKPLVKDLEKYLAGDLSGEALQQFEDTLAGDAKSKAEIGGFREQNAMLHTLRAPDEMDPAPGFYARVMDRIEAQAASSLWSVFFEPFFARKLAYASLALLVLLSSAAVTAMQNPAMHEAVPFELVAESILPPAPGEDLEYDRQIVFANLATFAGGAPAALMLTSADSE
jgi:hypothetical protein